jgi:hypothetical protein
VRRLRPKLWQQQNWLWNHDNAPSHFLVFTFSLFPGLKIKIKGHHFDKIEVIEAESQVVLNTLTEHDFQDAFKNCRSSGNDAYAWNEATLKVMVASRPKVSF